MTLNDKPFDIVAASKVALERLANIRPADPERKVSQETVTITSRRWLADLVRRHGPSTPEVMQLFLMQASGGGCPRCGKAWAYIPVVNRFSDFGHRRPACECYPRCPGVNDVFAAERRTDS